MTSARNSGTGPGSGYAAIVRLLGALAVPLPDADRLSVFVLFPVSFRSSSAFKLEHVQLRHDPFVGLGNYRRLLQNPEFWCVLTNTVVYTMGTSR